MNNKTKKQNNRKIKRKNTMKKKGILNYRKRKSMTKHKTPKKNKTPKKVYTKKDFNSGEGMLTSVWGPSIWHFLHTISFNYPVNPTKKDKEQYKKFILLLQDVLPCRYCRENLKNNLKTLPLDNTALKNRYTFSNYIYKLHELINKMLGKKSGLSFCDVRERYEHFRSRCTIDMKREELEKLKKKTIEKGCVEPLYGKKSKCIIKIVPQDEKCDTFQIDKKCIKKIL